jgi:hypothetical protein
MMTNLTIGKQKDTAAWIIQVWISFMIASISTGIGIMNLRTDLWQKAFVGLGFLYSVTTSFTLAKTVRDQHEARNLIARVDEARVEKLLSESHPLK